MLFMEEESFRLHQLCKFYERSIMCLLNRTSSSRCCARQELRNERLEMLCPLRLMIRFKTGWHIQSKDRQMVRHVILKLCSSSTGHSFTSLKHTRALQTQSSERNIKILSSFIHPHVNTNHFSECLLYSAEKPTPKIKTPDDNRQAGILPGS